MRARESLALPRPLIKVVSGEREFDLYERYVSPVSAFCWRGILYAVTLGDEHREGVGAAE